MSIFKSHTHAVQTWLQQDTQSSCTKVCKKYRHNTLIKRATMTWFWAMRGDRHKSVSTKMLGGFLSWIKNATRRPRSCTTKKRPEHFTGQAFLNGITAKVFLPKNLISTASHFQQVIAKLGLNWTLHRIQVSSENNFVEFWHHHARAEWA